MLIQKMVKQGFVGGTAAEYGLNIAPLEEVVKGYLCGLCIFTFAYGLDTCFCHMV